jgi:protein-S-isoprenylcysteine O-methyltransferase Ste14
LGWGLFLTSVFLLVHSLFVNLPFRKTYVTTGVGGELITTGVYALVRHPGVLWFTLVMLSLILVSRSSLLLIAAPVWILLNVLLVVIEDKFIFGKMFSGYGHYRQKTPMILPNKRSVGAFLRFLRQAS